MTTGKITKFVRFCDGLHDHGKMVPLDDWHNHIVDYNKDLYRSIYVYGPEHVEIFKSQKHLMKQGSTGEGSVQGIKGLKTNMLVFDFDDKEIEKSQRDALVLISRLKKYGIDSLNYNITYSGNKGFSVELYTDKEYDSSEMKTIARNLAGDLKTWDTKVYNDNRIFRIPGTRHNASGLYKTILTETQLKLLDVADIKELAKTRLDAEWVESPNRIPDELLIAKQTKAEELIIAAPKDIDFSKCPHDMPKWKYAIMHGFFPVGNGHDALLALAAHFRSLGYPIEATRSIVYSASELQYQRNKEHYKSDPTDERNIDRIVDDVYSKSWMGGTYESNQALKDSIYPDEAVSVADKTVVTIADMDKSFTHFAKNIKFNKVQTGFPEIDKKVTMTTGQLVYLLGSPGSGKTALSLNILNNSSKSNIPCMFFSLDMAQNMLFAKLISRETGISFDDVIAAFESGDPITQQWKKMLGAEFENVAFYFKSGTTVDAIKREIIKYQNEIGQKVKLVIVDYLELLASPHSDSNQNSAYQANKLKDLTTDMDICTMLIVQPPKSAGDAAKPLTSMRQVKGSSVLEQNARIILGIYRDGFGPNSPGTDKFLTIVCLKNTFGPLFSVDMSFHGPTGKIGTLSADGHQELKRLRLMKEEMAKEKKENDDSWGF